jgi:hypothetical protein
VIKERGRKISAQKNRPAAVGSKMGKPSLPDDARIPLVSSSFYWLTVAPRKRRTLHPPVIAAPVSLFLVEIPLSQMIVQICSRSSCGEQLYRDAIVDPAASFKPEVRNPTMILGSLLLCHRTTRPGDVFSWPMPHRTHREHGRSTVVVSYHWSRKAFNQNLHASIEVTRR